MPSRGDCCANPFSRSSIRRAPVPPPVVTSCDCPAGEVAAVSDPESPYFQVFTKNNSVPEAIMFGGLTTASGWSSPSAGRLQYDGTQPLIVQVHGQLLARNTAVGGIPPAIPGTHGYVASLLRNGLPVNQSLWFEELITGLGGRSFHVQALLPANPGDFFEIGIVLDSTFVNGNTATLEINVIDLMAK